MVLAKSSTIKLESGVAVSSPQHPGIESDSADPAGLCATESCSDRTTLDLTAEATKASPRQCLHVETVSLTIEQRLALNNISFSARPGTLTAIIGPSGAGKSTLAKLIGGSAQPTVGTVTLEGRDLHAEFSSLRTRIGMVPQDDVVHRQLTVEQALGYAAELRLPPDTTEGRPARRGVPGAGRTGADRDTRGPGSTGSPAASANARRWRWNCSPVPSLLILDEPTSGLDPALDRQVMTMLRGSPTPAGSSWWSRIR